MRRLKVKLFTGLCPKLRRLDVSEHGPDLNFRLACIKDARCGAAEPECVSAARQVNSSRFGEDESEEEEGSGGLGWRSPDRPHRRGGNPVGKNPRAAFLTHFIFCLVINSFPLTMLKRFNLVFYKEPKWDFNHL